MKKFSLFLLLIVAISCSPVLFESPQPEDGNRLKQVPKDLWGFYKKDSDTLLISEYNFQFRSSLGIINKLDFDLRNEDFMLIQNGEKYYLNVKKKEEQYTGWVVSSFTKSGNKLELKIIEELKKADPKGGINFSGKTKLIRDENGNTIATILTSEDFKMYDKLLDSAETQIFIKR